MTHSHPHSHALPGGPAPLGPLAAKAVVVLLGVIGIAVIVGAVVLWPNTQKVDIPMPFQNATGAAVTTEGGHVLSSEIATCGSPSAGTVLIAPAAPAPPGGGQCALDLIGIDSGPNSGANTSWNSAPDRARRTSPPATASASAAKLARAALPATPSTTLSGPGP